MVSVILENMDKVKILVACHKPWDICKDDIYTPIHVGRSVSKFKDEMSDMLGDDTGDNISDKNPQYSELTAQYWAWKNLPDVEYIGFCHYRRYFNLQITQDNIDSLFRDTDVICTELIFKHMLFYEILQSVSIEDLTILIMVLKKKYPEYENVVIDYLCGCTLYAKNMLICKKEVFDGYAEWLFDILFECEKYIKPSPYSRGKRSFAYFGEYLLPVYLLFHHYRLKKVDYVDYVGQKKNVTIVKRIMDDIKRFHGVVEKFYCRRPKSWDFFIHDDVLVGFKNDKIEVV